MSKEEWYIAVLAISLLVTTLLLVRSRQKIALLATAVVGTAKELEKWRDENHRVRQALLKLAFPSSVTTSHETREELKKLLEETR